MSATAVQPSPVLPFNDPSRRRRLVKVGAWLVGIALVVVLLNLLGVDVVGWLQDAWDQIRDVPAGYIVAGLVFQTGQTLFAGLSYYGILRAAYPGQVEFWPIVTAYAAGVAMNNFLPANIGTFATLVMFVAIIPACTFRCARGLPRPEDLLHDRRHVRLPLPVLVRARLVRCEPRKHLGEPVATVLIALGAVILIMLLGRIFWRQLKKLWAMAKQEGVISPARRSTSRARFSHRSCRGSAS